MRGSSARPDGSNRACVQWTATNGHADTAKKLIELGASVAPTNQFGWTALHHAANWGYDNVCKVLIENGADPMAKSESGKTPAEAAAFKGFDNVLSAIESVRAPPPTPTTPKAGFPHVARPCTPKVGGPCLGCAPRINPQHVPSPPLHRFAGLAGDWKAPVASSPASMCSPRAPRAVVARCSEGHQPVDGRQQLHSGH